MYAFNRMTPNPVTISPKSTAKEALDIMNGKNFSNLPVISKGEMVGIIAKEDIVNQYFCSAKGCNFLEDSIIEDLMTKNFVTINKFDYIEKAIYLLREKDISAIPVMDVDKKLIGIITRTDIFDAFADTMGVDNEGTRIYIHIPDFVGQIAKIANIIKGRGISIEAMSLFDSGLMKTKQLVMKVDTKDVDDIVEDLKNNGIDVRDVGSY